MKLKRNETVWDLDLHETLRLKDGWAATRVPGGWLYHHEGSPSMAFVPFFSRHTHESA